MPVARVYTAQPGVLRGDIVTIETDLTRGLHSFSIVGLAGKAVEEAKDRVSAAIKNSGFKSPKSQNHKVIVSLAPADLKKEGPLFDLPIAVSYLLASGDVSADVSRCVLIGELALDGTLRPVRGVLPAVRTAQHAGYREVIVPRENATEAALITDVTVTAATSLKEVIMHLYTEHQDHIRLTPTAPTTIEKTWQESGVLLEDIKGQETAKRGLLIAAAGRHNVLMVGPPGTGKTMLARVFRGLLPPLKHEEALEVMSIHSLTSALADTPSSEPPFRAPHHTASHTALVGGGTHPKPGEVTLAHHGVLFMDEFPEFERRSLDALRQPLEDKVVAISRVQGSALFPADFVLIAAMNPHRGAEDGTTDYHAAMLESYKGKVSGPILDRIDLWLEVPHVPYETLTSTEKQMDETVAARKSILNARQQQYTRLSSRGITTNAAMNSRDLEELIPLGNDVQDLVKSSAEKLNLSPRSYHRLIKVAQTIADLDQAETIETKHVFEALQYRVKM